MTPVPVKVSEFRLCCWRYGIGADFESVARAPLAITKAPTSPIDN